MWISDTSIKRPVFATMFIVSFMVLGIVSMTRLGIDLFPGRQLPLRERLGGLSGRGAGRSRDAGHQADRGRGRRHQRRQARDLDLDRRLLARRRRAAARSRSAGRRRGGPREGGRHPLSAAASKSRIRPSSGSTSRRCRSWCSRSARSQPSDVTRRQVEDDLKPLLEQIDGVAAVRSQRRRSPRDPGQPRSAPPRSARACRSPAVASKLAAENLDVPGGQVKRDGQIGLAAHQGRVPGSGRESRTSSCAPTADRPCGSSDVGVVVDGYEERTSTTRLERRRRRVVLGPQAVRRQHGGRSPTQVDAALARLAPSFPQLQISQVHERRRRHQRERRGRARATSSSAASWPSW